jgi:hypothetical protein
MTGNLYAGGSGAFVSCDMAVATGTTIYLVVGQGGLSSVYGTCTGSIYGGGGTLFFSFDIACFYCKRLFD